MSLPGAEVVGPCFLASTYYTRIGWEKALIFLFFFLLGVDIAWSGQPPLFFSVCCVCWVHGLQPNELTDASMTSKRSCSELVILEFIFETSTSARAWPGFQKSKQPACEGLVRECPSQTTSTRSDARAGPAAETAVWKRRSSSSAAAPGSRGPRDDADRVTQPRPTRQAEPRRQAKPAASPLGHSPAPKPHGTSVRARVVAAGGEGKPPRRSAH